MSNSFSMESLIGVQVLKRNENNNNEYGSLKVHKNIPSVYLLEFLIQTALTNHVPEKDLHLGKAASHSLHAFGLIGS